MGGHNGRPQLDGIPTVASHNGRPQWEATVGGHSWTVFPVWPPTRGGHSGRPQWEYQESRIKSQRVNSQESKSQRVNKSLLIGITRWDNCSSCFWSKPRQSRAKGGPKAGRSWAKGGPKQGQSGAKAKSEKRVGPRGGGRPYTLIALIN